jgi:hypothetical protein
MKMNHSPSRSAKKYRPYFTLSELQTLVASLGIENSNERQKSLCKYLESFIYEITKGYRAHSHITSPRATIEERLGVDVNASSEDIASEQARLIKAMSDEK